MYMFTTTMALPNKREHLHCGKESIHMHQPESVVSSSYSSGGLGFKTPCCTAQRSSSLAPACVHCVVAFLLLSGSLSTDGLLVVRVIAAAEDSTPARIAQLAAEAQVRAWCCFHQTLQAAVCYCCLFQCTPFSCPLPFFLQFGGGS